MGHGGKGGDRGGAHIASQVLAEEFLSVGAFRLREVSPAAQVGRPKV
jgi:hypothetical protein